VTVAEKAGIVRFPVFENKINVVMVKRRAQHQKSVDIAQFNEAGSLKYDDYDPLSVVHVWILNGARSLRSPRSKRHARHLRRDASRASKWTSHAAQP
jgi:hypothetical protein